MVSYELITRIKQANRIEDVIKEFGISLKNNKARCPFHHPDRHPSFCVDSERQIAKCFACMPRAVDVVGFVMKIKNLSFSEAIRFLAQRAGIEVEQMTPEEEEAVQKSMRRQEILETTTQFYQTQLAENNYEDSLGYIKEKGFTKDMLEFFRIGLAERNGLRNHLIENGFTEEECIDVGVLTIRNGKVCDFFQNCLIFPILVKGEVVSITARKLVRDVSTNKWLHLKGEMKNLYNEDGLELEGDILICEGPSDTITAIMNGYNAVGIFGALSFKQEYYEKFKGKKIKQIFVCADADEAGKEGAKKIAEIFMGEERIIDLPAGQDLSDYFKTHNREQFEELRRKAKNWQEKMLDEEEAIQIHLTDADDAKYSDKKVMVGVMVCAIGETFHVPKVFSARCEAKDCDNIRCPIRREARRFFIPSNSKDLIDFTRFSDEKIMRRLRMLVPCEENKKHGVHIEILERITVQEVLVIPMARRVEMKHEGDISIVVDELGKEYRDKKAFLLTALPKTNEYLRAYGWVKSNPKTQIATLLIYKFEPITNDYENFQLTEKVKKEFEVFQVTRGHTIESKLKEILSDITNNITEIYGEHRERALLCMLLTYHSQISFEFGGEKPKKGWIDFVLVGDTGQGKTQMYDNLSRAIGLGEFISGTSASRTGICYSYQKIGDTWFLKWGKYPLNDGRLLFIDEGQCLSIDEWEKMSSGRSDGLIRADGVKSGEHPTRTRLIVSANPKDNKILDDCMCGVETLKHIFRAADIRRFDLAIFLSSSDQSSDIVNIPKSERSKSKQIITPLILRNSVCWAWTRKAEDIIFENEAVKQVYSIAKELIKLYDSAKDIPLVTTDIRHKVARISVALATLLHSTDEEHRKVIVKKEHVDYVGKLIQEIFNHENCGLNIYAGLRKASSTLTEGEFAEILAILINEGMATISDDAVTLTGDTRLIFLDFANNEVVERSQLAEALDITADSISRKLKILKDLKLIKGKSGKRGYRKTPKFNKILRLLFLKGYLKREE